MATMNTVNDNTDAQKGHASVVHEDNPDKEIVVAPGGEASDKLIHDLAFMNEPVEVMILETQNQNDSTRLVTVGVNGKQFHFLRGQWRKCPRYVLEILARAKRENWAFSYKKNADGSTSDINQMHRMLRYPHQYRDNNPKGPAWYESIKDLSF